MANGNSELRAELYRLTLPPEGADFGWLDVQVREMEALNERIPHSVRLHTRFSLPIYEVNCLMFALGIEADAVRDMRAQGRSVRYRGRAPSADRALSVHLRRVVLNVYASKAVVRGPTAVERCRVQRAAGRRRRWRARFRARNQSLSVRRARLAPASLSSEAMNEGMKAKHARKQTPYFVSFTGRFGCDPVP
jgi:hypothetical protein